MRVYIFIISFWFITPTMAWEDVIIKTINGEKRHAGIGDLQNCITDKIRFVLKKQRYNDSDTHKLAKELINRPLDLIFKEKEVDLSKVQKELKVFLLNHESFKDTAKTFWSDVFCAILNNAIDQAEKKPAVPPRRRP